MKKPARIIVTMAGTIILAIIELQLVQLLALQGELDNRWVMAGILCVVSIAILASVLIYPD